MSSIWPIGMFFVFLKLLRGLVIFILFLNYRSPYKSTNTFLFFVCLKWLKRLSHWNIESFDGSMDETDTREIIPYTDTNITITGMHSGCHNSSTNISITLDVFIIQGSGTSRSSTMVGLLFSVITKWQVVSGACKYMIEYHGHLVDHDVHPWLNCKRFLYHAHALWWLCRLGYIICILWINQVLDQCYVLTSERENVVSSCGVSKLFEFRIS